VVGFVQQSLELSENSGSSSASVCIELLGGNIDQIIFFEINQVEGSAEGSDYTPALPVVQSLTASTQMSCFTLTVVDDNTVEGTEDLTLELSMITSVTSVVILDPSQLTITITDNDEDTRLFFVGDTPIVDGNTVSAAFTVGSSFTSVLCLISTQETPTDCSGGSVLYTGLNPNRGRAYTLEITGTLPGGTTVLLNRDVHLDTIATCSVHFINEGVTVNGDTVTFEWEGTGPGALLGLDLIFECKIDGVTNIFTECTSPYTVTSPVPLLSGQYTLVVRTDPQRTVCTRRFITHLTFQIP
jgi:hypothetical protein